MRRWATLYSFAMSYKFPQYLHFCSFLENAAVGHLVVLGALPEAYPERREHPQRLVDDHVEVLEADEGAVVWEPVFGLGDPVGLVNLLLEPLLNIWVQICNGSVNPPGSEWC